MSYEFHFAPEDFEASEKVYPHSGEIQRWADAWAEHFRQDAAQVENEVASLCSRIRTVLDSIEGKTTL